MLRSIPMGLLVVILLTGLWASILLPAAVRSRRHFSPIHSVDEFERNMGMLAPKPTIGPVNQRPLPGRHVMVLDRPSAVTGLYRRNHSAVERRRMILFRLLGALAATGFVAVLFGGIFWNAFLIVLIAVAGYVGLLARMQMHRAEVERKIHRLPSRPVPFAAQTAMNGPPGAGIGNDFDGRQAVGGGPGPSGTVRVRSWPG